MRPLRLKGVQRSGLARCRGTYLSIRPLSDKFSDDFVNIKRRRGRSRIRAVRCFFCSLAAGPHRLLGIEGAKTKPCRPRVVSLAPWIGFPSGQCTDEREPARRGSMSVWTQSLVHAAGCSSGTCLCTTLWLASFE